MNPERSSSTPRREKTPWLTTQDVGAAISHFYRLKALLDQQRWSDFDSEFARVALTEQMRGELLEQRGHSNSTEQMNEKLMELKAQGRKTAEEKSSSNALKLLIDQQKWNEFEVALADSMLPEQRREELRRLKAEGQETEQRQKEKSLFDTFRSMIRQKKWTYFDDSLAEAEVKGTLSLARRGELLELKAQAIDAEQKQEEQALFDRLKSMLSQKMWDHFDDSLARVVDKGTLSPPRRVELLRLKAQAIDAELEQQEQALFDRLKSMLSERSWDNFHKEFGEVTLPAPRREELLRLKAQAIDAEQEERRRQVAIEDLQSLINERKWHSFDAGLAKASLLEAEREELLGLKAIALSKSIPPNVSPDAAQARILASPAKTLRVTARAGSGKTRLLTALGYFLVKQCGYQPTEILLLAFNRDAATQLEDRLTKLLNIPAFPGARTFHSLAYGIVQPNQDLIYDQGEEVSQRELTSLVQNILRGLLDAKLLDDVYELFRRETTEARVTGAFLTGEAAYDFRRTLTHFTLGGKVVKSCGEKYISDFLFEHGLTHYYEDPFRWDNCVYRPDFKIMTGEKQYVIWEHWAVDPDAKSVSDSREWPAEKLREYQEEARRKREYWRNKEVLLIESSADACGNRKTFETAMAKKLLPHFPKLQRQPRAQLLEKLVAVHLSKLAAWLGQAIQRAQKRDMDAAGLSQELAKYHAVTEREKLFLTLLEKVFAAYEPRLEAEEKTDFDRLFNRAISLLRANPPQTLLGGKQTTIDLRRLRYCLIDEAQDLSPQFIDSISCLRELNPKIKLIFVGDDWQAINRFAGSDVELFTETIATCFGKCATPTLATNYRSVRNVVLAGNKLMKGQGDAAVPHMEATGIIQLAYLDKVQVQWRESEFGWREDSEFRRCGSNGLAELFKALYQLAITDLVDGKTIGVLFRTNTNMRGGKKLPEMEKIFVRLIRSMGWPKKQVEVWQKEKIRFSTAHRFKGAERQTVFVVDPHTGNFPLLNADSIELFRFFGDSLEQAEADERRLFYVAITRAEERLVFLTETRRDKEDSPYLSAFRDLVEVIQVPKEVIMPPQPKTLETADGEDKSELDSESVK